MSSVVLVTGASGFAGGHLLQHLASPDTVVAWSRSTPPRELAQLARWRRVDLLDRDDVRHAIASLRPSHIYHCAGVPHVAESWLDTSRALEGNVLATENLLDALRRAEVAGRVLLPGSSAVYATSNELLAEDHPLSPASPYALSKLAQEELARRAFREDGIEIVITRSFNHTGPRQSGAFAAPSIARQIAIIEAGLVEPVIRVGNLDARRDLTDVRDVVSAYVALMRAGVAGSVYNVASGVARTIRSLLEALVARSKVAVRVEMDPSRIRPNDVPMLAGDYTRLTLATGWRPSISFDQMLDDLLAYWRERVEKWDRDHEQRERD
ncbi:MAG TPA: GDP-mannose 4,6-dehydratase [Vicinamibacterales bacterium]